MRAFAPCFARAALAGFLFFGAFAFANCTQFPPARFAAYIA